LASRMQNDSVAASTDQGGGKRRGGRACAPCQEIVGCFTPSMSKPGPPSTHSSSELLAETDRIVGVHSPWVHPPSPIDPSRGATSSAAFSCRCRTKHGRANRRAAGEPYDAGNVWYSPRPKFLELGMTRVCLGRPLPYEHGIDPNDYRAYRSDDPIKGRIMALHTEARERRRADKIARKMAKQTADARSPDR
jgi:hypothetical protein